MDSKTKTPMTGARVHADRAFATHLIAAQFPEFQPVELRHLGEGCDSVACLVNGEWVFRFPKREDVERQLLGELSILPKLVPGSPIPQPCYHFHGQPTAKFPRHFAGYPLLRGIPALQLDPARLPLGRWAAEFGRFLSWLHRFPAHRLAPLGVEQPDPDELIDEVQADALADLAAVARVAPDRPIRQWRLFLSRRPPRLTHSGTARVLIHGDLAAEHVLCDPERLKLTGIIDWSEIGLGDPAVDFAGLCHWGGPRLVEQVLAHYDGPTDGALQTRANYLAACRGAADVAFGLEFERPEYLAAGLRALDQCIGFRDLDSPPRNHARQ